MNLAGVTLHEFLRIGVIASLFIVLLKFAIARVPAPRGLASAVGSI